MHRVTYTYSTHTQGGKKTQRLTLACFIWDAVGSDEEKPRKKEEKKKKKRSPFLNQPRSFFMTSILLTRFHCCYFYLVDTADMRKGGVRGGFQFSFDMVANDPTAKEYYLGHADATTARWWDDNQKVKVTVGLREKRAGERQGRNGIYHRCHHCVLAFLLFPFLSFSLCFLCIFFLFQQRSTICFQVMHQLLFSTIPFLFFLHHIIILFLLFLSSFPVPHSLCVCVCVCFRVSMDISLRILF
jgi:hypothetical protein